LEDEEQGLRNRTVSVEDVPDYAEETRRQDHADHAAGEVQGLSHPVRTFLNGHDGGRAADAEIEGDDEQCGLYQDWGRVHREED
jgi:hypothetical protein